MHLEDWRPTVAPMRATSSCHRCRSRAGWRGRQALSGCKKRSNTAAISVNERLTDASRVNNLLAGKHVAELIRVVGALCFQSSPIFRRIWKLTASSAATSIGAECFNTARQPLCRSDIEGRKTERASCPATHPAGIDRQPENCESPRPCSFACSACARRRSDRIRRPKFGA